MIKDNCDNCYNFPLYPYSTTCLECGKSPKNRKPVTNGDRIRAMTDEELAKWFGTHACCMRDPFVCSKTGGSCKACWLDWLRQEAADEL